MQVSILNSTSIGNAINQSYYSSRTGKVSIVGFPRSKKIGKELYFDPILTKKDEFVG